MVGMTRAHICDPELVSKLKRGVIEQIRPCVGANVCIANRYNGKPISCAHNSAVSNPGHEIVEAEYSRRIAVIGAGPAGLEVARLASIRGHQVDIYEAKNDAGGQLGLWASSPSMRELDGIVRWRLSELERHQVPIHFNRRMVDKNLGELECDAVIIATGANDYFRLIDGDHNIDVISAYGLLDGYSVNASKAIVLNEGRGQAGLIAAEYLLNKGIAVEIMTSDIAVANDLDPTNRNAWYSRLGELGCHFSAAKEIIETEQDKVRFRNIYDTREGLIQQIDLIVDWPGCWANGDWVKTTSDKPIYHIGDCVTPRSLELAISEAHELGISI